MLRRLLFHRVRPVFVFDGSAPALKRRTTAARRKYAPVLPCCNSPGPCWLTEHFPSCRRRDQQAVQHRKLAEQILAKQLQMHALQQVAAAQAASVAGAARPAPATQQAAGASAGLPATAAGQVSGGDGGAGAGNGAPQGRGRAQVPGSLHSACRISWSVGTYHVTSSWHAGLCRRR